MSLWNRITTYLSDAQNLRKVVLIFIGVIFLGGVVLFNSNIQQLLRSPWPSRADGGSETVWSDIGLPNLYVPRSNAKLIDVEDNDGTRWLYAIGGVNDDGLVKKVERIKIDNDPDPNNVNVGKPIGVWEPVVDMNFGHAEFGLIVHQDYIYVIAGDIHVPKTEDDPNLNYALIYSTIEILDYKDPNAIWQVYALISGVNFFPEVALIGDQLHIVGGIYGNPFQRDGLWATYFNMDTEADLAAWDDLNLASKRLIGGVPLSIHRAGMGELMDGSDNTSDPPPFVPPLPPEGGWPDEVDMRFYQFGNNFGASFANLVHTGEFATTVNEHYILDLAKPPSDPSFIIKIGELDTDYEVSTPPLSGRWIPGEVNNFGPIGLYTYLKFFSDKVNSDPQQIFYYSIAPLAQGRYGHKLVVHNGNLMVLGGASWTSTLNTFMIRRISTKDPECQEACLYHYETSYFYSESRHFWVIDDEYDPYTSVGLSMDPPIYYYPRPYVGNIAYMWDDENLRWNGTNSDMAGFVGRNLSNNYAFKLPELIGAGKKGRAFFGLAELDSLETVPVSNNYLSAVATGGLQNSLIPNPRIYTGWYREFTSPQGDIERYSGSITALSVDVIDATETLTEDNIGWVHQDNYVSKSYNLFSVGIDKYRSISFDGQLKFQDETDMEHRAASSQHVPDYLQTGPELSDGTTSMFVGDQWLPMPAGMNLFTFSAVKDVRVTDTNNKTTVYIYKIGGVVGPELNASRTPIVSTDAQYLGPFMYGEPGVPDPRASTFTVYPAVVYGDNRAHATATVTLRDYYRDVVANKHVVAYTSTGTLPPDNSNDPVRVETFGAAEGGLGEPRDDTVFPYPYLQTDSQGQAQFKLYYQGDIADLPYDLDVYLSFSDDDGTLGETSPLGPRPLSFIKDGVPFDTESTITAIPYKVAVDGVSTSTITLTLKDGNGLPVPGYRVDVTSDRNDGLTIIDVIDPDPSYENPDPEHEGEYITDSNGEVLFYISSVVKGIARLHGSYEYPTLPGTWVELTAHALVEFAGYIEGLFPPSGVQGDKLPWMIIQGAQTEWNSSSTIVEFIGPDDVSFYQPLAGGEVGDIEDVRFVADGHSATVLGIYNRNFADSNITIALDSGDGVLRKGLTQGSSIDTQLDTEGKVLFEYIAGVTPSIIKIRATISGGNNPSADMWFVQEPATINPYHLEIYAEPLSLEAADDVSVVSARIYRMVNGQKEIIDDEPSSPISFEFVVDDEDSGGSMDPVNIDFDVDGIARSTYNKSNEPGKARVFVSAMYQGLYIADKVILTKIPDAGSSITPDSTVIHSTELITLGGDIEHDDDSTAPFEYVRIALDAKIGIWTVRVTTPNVAGPGTSFENMPSIEEHPFVVLPLGVATSLALNIDPKQGLRGTNSMTVSIYGTATLFFTGATEIIFRSPTGVNHDRITVLATRIFGPESAEVDIKIDNNADIGWWPVRAVTDLGGGNIQEIETILGEHFSVTDDNGYFVNVSTNLGNPPNLPRDGQAQAIIKVIVGEVDPFNGEIILLENIDVTLTKHISAPEYGVDYGVLNPIEITTNEDGEAFSTYTTDSGEDNQTLIFEATIEPEPNTIASNWTHIFKVVHPYAGFVLTANPTEIPLKGTGSIAVSNLVATGLPADEDGLVIIPVTFVHANNSRGHIEPVNTTTTTGEATSSYIAAPEESRIPEMVEVYASAIVPGYGQISSNTEMIQIGRDPDKYDLTLVANPMEVLAGGDERSTLTAILTYQYSPVSDWPIDFEIVNPDAGDYITQPSVRTAYPSGEAGTEFAPGNIAGPAIIRARPLGLNIFEEIIITKGFDTDPDPDLSTISAVPRYVPTSDGEDYSIVTVTLRNVNYVPLPGIQVALTTDRIADTVRLADGTSDNVIDTDYRGRAIFRVSSTQTGMSAVTGTLSGGFELGTEVVFESPGSLIWHNLKVIVPFEARDYDNEVWLYLTEDGSDNPVFINEVYRKNPRPNNLVQELYEIKIYLHANSTYTMWAKGRYHKAKIYPPITTGSIGKDDLRITFDELLIGDLEPASSGLHKRSAPYEDEDLPTPYHDNFVNTIDLPPIYNSWFANSYLADFFRDFMVNSIDFNYWVSNYGPGVDGNGPPPLYD